MSGDGNPSRRTGITMLVVAWAVLFGLVYWLFNAWEQDQINPNTYSVLESQSGELVLERNRSGHYVAEGTINDTRVTFLLDTGATQVALSTRLAKTMGLKLQPPVPVQTASGTTAGYPTRLASVRVGPVEMHDVSAIATEGMGDNVVLLGMSFLKRLEFTQTEGRLILRAGDRKG